MSTPAPRRRTRTVSLRRGTELVVRATASDLVVVIEGDGELALAPSTEPSRAATQARPRRRDLRVERALAAVRAEPARRHTVSTLAKIAGTSRSTFMRLFARSLGTTPRAWLAAERLDLARTLLTETDDGLAEIASRTGYASEFSFSRAFKRHFGVAPGVFRRATASAPAPIRCAA